MNSSLQSCCLAVLALACHIGASPANADARADEQRIREQLVQPTRLDCKLFPLTETIDFLADFHDIPMSLDIAEIKRIGIDLGPSQVTKKTSGRLDDTLIEILGPFNLSFMIEDNKLLITSQLKARVWQEAYATATGRAK